MRCMTLQNRHDSLEALFKGGVRYECAWNPALAATCDPHRSCTVKSYPTASRDIPKTLTWLLSFPITYFLNIHADLNARKLLRLPHLLNENRKKLLKKKREIAACVNQIQTEARDAADELCRVAAHIFSD